jgi:hypothetical protein
MKIQSNSKLGGALLIASSLCFFVTAALMHQPAFSGVGAALFVIGVAVRRKGVGRDC